ncbi:LAMI_0D04940g1_1 [Lachancea mirantina]|uniref:LAMI_0D04940g1_1 n=1 Tax=Lachancea mirantina TaxID=1230905 RepID=A0A1G4JAP7_9SACH|nr:LAMI_0D04940g1_1 [Lachancea mirantina]
MTSEKQTTRTSVRYKVLGRRPLALQVQKKSPATFFLSRLSGRGKRARKLQVRSVLPEITVRYGVCCGKQDLRQLNCQLLGIRHGLYLKPNDRCFCRTHVVISSPLAKEISRTLKEPRFQ